MAAELGLLRMGRNRAEGVVAWTCLVLEEELVDTENDADFLKILFFNYS